MSVRQFYDKPLLSASILLVLAIAIGANTAILSALWSLVIQDPPYPGADRMVIVWEQNKSLNFDREGVSGPTYLDWRERSKSFEDLAVMEVGTGTLTGLGEPLQFPGMRVSSNFLKLIGAKAVRGRIFEPKDGAGSTFAPLAVITSNMWQRLAGSDPDIVGRAVQVDLLPYSLIGVLDRNFWVPVACDGLVVWPDAFLRSRQRNQRFLAVIGRLRPGVTVEQARQELSAISAASGDSRMKGWGANVALLRDVMSEGLKPSLWALMVAAVLVLSIGCANIANLLLARALARRQEVSVRMALGASKSRLAQQFLTESVVLSAAGGVVGIILGIWLLDGAQRLIPSTLPLRSGGGEVVLRSITLSTPVLIIAIAASILTGVLFGLAPLWEAIRTDIRSTLNDSTRGTTGRSGHLRRALLVSQVALTLVLLAGAGVLLRSFLHQRSLDLGFDREKMLTLSIELPTDSRYKERDKVRYFFTELRRRLAETPGIASVGLSNALPLSPAQEHASFRIESGPALAAGDALSADLRVVTPGYFETLRIPIRRGRAFEESDLRDRKYVALIDEGLGQRYFKDKDPIGQRLLLGSRAFEVVGIAGRSQHDPMSHREPATLYLVHDQEPAPRMDLAVRTAGAPMGMLAKVKETVWSIDKDIPVYRVRTMQDAFDATTLNARLVLMLVGCFALSALLLAAVGTYGVVAYQTGARIREFSIRMALGADASQVIGIVMADTLKVAGIGLAIGLVASVALLRLLESQLFGVRGADPLSLAVTTLVLLFAAVLAALGPALRVIRADAAHELRSQ